MEKVSYNNYFSSHYGSTFSKKDLVNYEQWFYAQWKLISQYIAVNKNTKILEIGSGVGGFYQLLAKNIDSKNYIGIELDEEACKFANAYFKNNVFKEISFEDFTTIEKYDYVFAFEVLEHLENPTQAVRKIHSLLKEGGYFIGTSPYPYTRNIVGDKTHLSVLHPLNWHRIFTHVGFSLIQIHPMSFLPYVWRINKHFNIRIPIYIPFMKMVSTALIIARK